jgi:Fe-coproporphyrin III synthase
MRTLFRYTAEAMRNRNRNASASASTKMDALPRMLTFIVSFRCNARCIMCDSWKKDGTGDMTLEQIESVFHKLPKLDAVRLTGGEPFARKDFPEIASMAQRLLNPQVLHITSNGFLSDAIIDYTHKRDTSKKLYLLISIDGTEATHNRIRGVKNAWQRAITTINGIAPYQKEKNIHLMVNQTIVDDSSMDEYSKLHPILKNLGVQHNVVFAYDESATYSAESAQKEFVYNSEGEFSLFSDLSKDRMKSFFEELHRDSNEMPITDRWAKRYYYQGIKNRLLHGVGSPNPPCVALSSHLRLYPNGDVPTCQFNNKIAGNLLTQTWDEYWESTLRQAQRKWVQACKGCWAECEVLPNSIYTADILNPSRLFKSF